VRASCQAEEITETRFGKSWILAGRFGAWSGRSAIWLLQSGALEVVEDYFEPVAYSVGEEMVRVAYCEVWIVFGDSLFCN